MWVVFKCETRKCCFKLRKIVDCRLFVKIRIVAYKLIVACLAMPLRHCHRSGIGLPRPFHIRLCSYTLCVVLHISTNLFYYT